MIDKREGFLKKGTIIFDKYTIVTDKPIGKGSNWLVYICSDYVGHLFCIKEYYPINSDFYRDEQGFLRCSTDISFIKKKEVAIDHELEMQNAARNEFIENDNIDKISYTNWEAVYSAYKLMDFQYGDTFYVIMDVLSGQSLSDIIDNGFANKIEALKVLIELGGVIELLHKKGILHLDIKPENFFVTKAGKIIVLDFGSSIFKGKKYSKEEVERTGVGKYTEGFCSSELIVISQEESVDKKVELLSKLDEKSDVFAYKKIAKIILEKVEESELSDLLQKKYDSKKYRIIDYVRLLEDRLITEYHKIDSDDSLLDYSRKLFLQKKQKEKLVHYYPDLCRNKETNENIDINRIITFNKDMVIQGGEGSGKTAILIQAWQELLNKRCLVAYVDLRTIDSDTQEAWEYLINIVKIQYHIDIANNDKRNIIILCDNLLSLDTAIAFHEFAKIKGISLIMTVSDCGREISSDYNEMAYYSLGELTLDQKKSFFMEWKGLYIDELKELEEGETFNNICSIEELIITRKIKRSDCKIRIGNISIFNEKYKILVEDEHIPEKKLALVYGYEHFLPWLAIHLYFDKNYLFRKNGESLDSIQKRIPEHPYLISAINYYFSVGILMQGRKEYCYVPIKTDYEEDVVITSYESGHRIYFVRNSEFCYFVAKYILNDYKSQQHKENSLLCRFQFHYLVIKQLSFLVDFNTLLSWYSVDGMASYRYASRNIIAAIIEKGGMHKRIDVGIHVWYDEIWPEMNEIIKYIDKENFRNEKHLHILKRKEVIYIYYGNQSSTINVNSWKGNIDIQKNQIYKVEHHLESLSLEESGIKKIFHLKNFEITDKMELPLLTHITVVSGYEKITGSPIFTDRVIVTAFKTNIGEMYSEVIDVYDLFNKTYVLARIENPLKIGRIERFSVSELHYDEKNCLISSKELFNLEARYFKNDEFPLVIKGCNQVIALGMVSKRCMDNYLHVTYYDLYNDYSKLSYALQFYINFDRRWYRYPIQLNWERIKYFDVMDFEDDKAIIIYLSDGKLKYRLFFNKDIRFNDTPILYSDSLVSSFALLKESRNIALIDAESCFKVINLNREVIFKLNFEKYDIKKDSLKAIDNEYLWIQDINDKRKCYIISLKEKTFKIFEIPFK